jgi:SAM-dependent methyltransferase
MNYHKFFTDNIDAGAEVLDVGCGLGELTYHIACNTNAKITGIEIRPEKVEKAKKKYSHGRIKFLVGDITKFDIDSKYNIVILSNVLEHITNRTDFLCDIVSRTCPEKILIRVPLFDREWRVPLKKELNLDWRLDPEHKTEYTIHSFENEMKESGLSIKSMQIRWGEIWAVVKPD